MLIDKSLLNAVGRLSPVTLEELNQAQLMDRVDTKFVASERLLPNLLQYLSDSYRVLEVDGTRCSPYRSDYFDSPNSKCYFKHHNGKKNRFKFRIREYVNSGLCFFEVKHRTNKGRTIKSRVLVDQGVALDSESEQLIAQASGGDIDIAPVLRTSYSRVTLVANDAIERVTIDVNLRFEMDESNTALPGVAIIEVKQNRDSRHSPIRQYLRRHHIAPLRLSKYCIGRAILDPTLKRNNFKPKLRLLRQLMT